MRARLLFSILAPLLAAALLLQVVTAQRRLRASRVTNTVERTSAAAAASAQGADLLRFNLAAIRQALADDPLEVRAHQAEGSILLLLGRPAEAIASYQRALAIQPGPELYLALGLAQLRSGDRAAARRFFAFAVVLDARLAAQVPAELR